MTDFWKNKKVIAYIALTHHTRFISPVMEKLSKHGAIIRYVVGQAERSQEITAINLGLDYKHVFDYVGPADQPEIQKNYHLLRDIFTKTLKNTVFFGTSPVTVIDKTIYATAIEYTGFKNLIKKEKPDICFALHELNRWGKIFSFWSKKMNVPIVTFQEGLYFNLDFGYTGHIQNSTLNLVWGDRIKKKLTSFEAPNDRIIPVGNTHLSNEIEFQKTHNIRKKMRTKYNCSNGFALLILFSGEIPLINELFPIFETVSKLKNKFIFIKFHPISKSDQVKKWISLIPDQYKKHITAFHDEENTYNLMSLSDACILLQSSTTGLEALSLGKPLIHLDVKMKQNLDNSFTELNVAAKMTPAELSSFLAEGKDFKNLLDKDDIKNYLKNELSGTGNAIEAVAEVSKKLIQSNQLKKQLPIKAEKTADKDWSIILPLSDHAANILKQLEAIAVNSENSGSFEIILIEPANPSKPVCVILDSLKGNVTRLPTEFSTSLPEIMNQASKLATGKTLLFLDKHLSPSPNWLSLLDKRIKKYDASKVFGTRVVNQRGSIMHAGIVVDKNHSPISAYKHLPSDFPAALKERPFKLVDHFICINRDFFFGIGGFWEMAGKFAFMDLCLRADMFNKSKDCCIYLPDPCMISLTGNSENFDAEASINFFGRWHGELWENQTDLYTKDHVSKEGIDAALMAQSMETANFME